MSDTTGQDATDRTRHDTTALVVSVAEAAEQLGISEGAVRKRIERGQLRAIKVRNQWRVTIDLADQPQDPRPQGARPDATRPDTTRRDTTNATRHDQTPAVSPAALAQLEAIRDQWLQPLIDQIREHAERLGRLEAERAALSRERDELASRVTDERALADQLVDALERERDALRWERDRLTEQLPTELASWQQLAELATERDHLRAELEQARSAQDAPVAPSAAHHAAQPPDEGDSTLPSPWWRRWWHGILGEP